MSGKNFQSIVSQNYDLQNRLLTLGQRTLKKGEIFLLAKAIADAVPLPKETTDNIRIHNLNYRNMMNTVIYAFEGFAYIPHEEVETIYRLVDELVSWRYAVASGTALCLFTGEANNFVDDVTGILRYVNMSDLAHGSDIAANANYMYNMFKDVVAILK